MPESDPSHSNPAPLSYASPGLGRRSNLLQVGGGLGIAACCIGILVFFAACFGFGAALYLSPLPLGMGVVGLVLSVVGGALDKHIEPPHVAAALFINLAGIVGGLMEMAAWLNWKIFA